MISTFTSHNKEWLISKVDTDEGGSIAQEFCELFGFNQYVDFETRSDNTLDLVISPNKGWVVAVANLGTSDHTAIKFKNSSAQTPPESTNYFCCARFGLMLLGITFEGASRNHLLLGTQMFTPL